MALFSFSRLSLPFSLTRHIWFSMTLLIGVFCFTAGTLWYKGLNWGIDFKGGILLEVRFFRPPHLAQLRRIVQHPDNFGKESTVQQYGDTKKHMVLIRAADKKVDLTRIQKRFQEELKDSVVFEKYDRIGAKLGKELMQASLWALIFALLGIGLYVWIRFDWMFSLATWISLAYDCSALLLFLSLFQQEIGEGAMVAFLITAGYSVNDTVIICDRIRENRGYKKTLNCGELVDLSINETLSRTILTSLTTLTALLVLYGLGGTVIGSYSLPMIVGIASGTISSIFIAAPVFYVLSWFNTRKKVLQK
ncbi:protein translocase subunit SecF [Holospora curviuscula]|uniref:Protein-export membrane protein SecF n=1 Tax=Holospora curviuscula TaxID=1082868 RepID=A0A2S5R7M7_9PROT|nr:protein translocase subunit SecF [Holospora curviuscula]PPE03125.1 preprotein translocase subunit SecF [Holospora curviuscula]